MNIANNIGDSPLLVAVKNGSYNMVEILLRWEDIKVNKATLYTAMESGYDNVAALLRKKVTQSPNETETCIVCMDRSPDVVLGPCGHENLCGACAFQWDEEKKGCPIDRFPISRIFPLREAEGKSSSQKRD